MVQKVSSDFQNSAIDTRFPKGRFHPHITQSHGADHNIMKFYHTRYGSSYGNTYPSFNATATFRHKGTGYSANLRPQIYYNRRLDELDNPELGRICQDNYHSVTEKGFRPYTAPDGKEQLPYQLCKNDAGFGSRREVTVPLTSEVRNVFIDTRTADAPFDMLPKYKPYLHSLESKDPVESENYGHGPKYMKSETQAKFHADINPHMDSSRKDVGRIENTGHTHNNPNVDNVQHRPNYCYRNDLPGFITNRPTGPSIYTTDYEISGIGRPSLPNLTRNASRDTGNTRENVDTVPPWGLSPNKSSPKGTTYTGDYRGLPESLPTDCDRLGRTQISDKVPSGAAINNDRYIATSDNPLRFTTHYFTRFQNPTLSGKDREGFIRGGVHDPWSDGFIKSEGLHKFGQEVNTNDILRSMDAYQGRSIRARDVYFDDHTHDSKLLRNQCAKLQSLAA